MSRFPRFFTHRALLLARNDGSIRAPVITENDGFFISRRYTIVSDRCFRCDHRRQRRRFIGSLYSWQSRPTLCLCYERQRSTTHPHPAQESFWTQQVVASLQGVGGHSPVLLTRRSMFSARPQTSVQSRAYWIFLLFFRRAFCALKYAIGTTGFTVILRATGRFMPFLTRSSL